MSSIASGALYNLTAFSMCTHNDTHVDTPFHFLGDGKTAEQLGLEIFVGNCFVARHTGNVSAAAAQAILTKAAPLNLAGSDGSPCRAYPIGKE